MKLYVDMDGVLADLDAHYKAVFGIEASKALDNIDWALVRTVAGFYAAIPPMPDFEELWAFIAPHQPTLLTGIPRSVAEAADNKRAWAAKHVGADVPVICCRSSEKSNYAEPGDVLIDDWPKYRDLWERKGGIWVTHINAVDTIHQLEKIL